MVASQDQRKAPLAQTLCHEISRALRHPHDLVQKTSPRVTRVGSWLRRLSIDELPQLVHAITGQMSLIGPRPPLPAEAAAYAPHEWRRLSMRPGLTGLWQVSGRADLPRARTMALDLAYVAQWFPSLDLWVLWRTVPAIVSGNGAR